MSGTEHFNKIPLGKFLPLVAVSIVSLSKASAVPLLFFPDNTSLIYCYY